jgi:hypothetical protein
MKRFAAGTGMAIGVAMLLAGAGGQPARAADELPKAESLLDKYVEATGGKAAYEKIHNEVSTGTMEFVGKGIKGKVDTYRADPDKSYVEISIEGIGKIQEGSDGKVAWTLSALQGPHVKEGEERASALQAAQFNSEVRWRDVYKTVRTAGVESVDGKDCYKVVMTPQEGSDLTRCYDKQSSLLVKSSMVVKSPMGDVPADSLIGDYRKEGDVLMPHKVTQKAMGQEFTITIDTVKFNTEISRDRFDPPDEIKALLQKK